MQVTVKVWAAHDRSLWETFDYYVRTYGDGGGEGVHQNANVCQQ